MGMMNCKRIQDPETGEMVPELDVDGNRIHVPFVPVFDDGRTKVSFQESTEISNILERAAQAGTLSHLARYGGEYGDFADFDFVTAHEHLARAKTIFEELPSEVRREFGHNPAAFFQYANDPANEGRLAELLPQIAEPGRYFPNPLQRQEAPSVSPTASGGPEDPARADQGESSPAASSSTGSELAE